MSLGATEDSELNHSHNANSALKRVGLNKPVKLKWHEILRKHEILHKWIRLKLAEQLRAPDFSAVGL